MGHSPATGAVYLTSKVNDGPDATQPHWYLHALDAASGAERSGFPVTIQGSPDGLEVDFGQVRTGAAKALGVNIVNTGTQPETITGTTAPAAPFTATNLPAAGTLLQPGASTVVTVTYAPTTGGDTGTADSGQLVVNGDAGSVAVSLAGTALTSQPQLTVTPKGLDYNTVPVGQSVTKTFDISNTGTVPLTITKAKAPTGVFSTDNPIAEGQVLAPGDVIHQTVTFTPTDILGATAEYSVNGSGGGSIYWTPNRGAWAVYGAIRQQWAARSVGNAAASATRSATSSRSSAGGATTSSTARSSGTPPAAPRTGGGGAHRPVAVVKRRSRRLLETTKTLESAMAAPAIMGLSRPSAASGRAATL